MSLNGTFLSRIQWILKIAVCLLLCMTVYRLFFFLHYCEPAVPFSGSSLWLGLRFDARVVAIVALSMFILSSVPVLNPFRKPAAVRIWTILLTLVFLCILLVYVSDFYHYDYLRQRLSASVLIFLEDAAISAQMMWETYPVVWIVLTLVIITYGWFRLMKYWLRGSVQPLQTMRKKNRVLVTVGFVLLCGVAIFGKIGQYPLRWSDAYALGNEFKASVALNPFQSFFSTMKYRFSSYNAEKVKAAYPLLASYLEVPAPNPQTLNFDRPVSYPTTGATPPNVVLVICESFAAPKSTMFGNRLNPTPFFDSLSRQGAFFSRCFTSGFGTARGVWATITGIPDVNRPRTASRNPLAVDQHTIINDFKNYEKMYFLGGSTTWANIRGLLSNNIEGIKIYEEDYFSSGKEDVWGISDKNLFLESHAILSRAKKPFFAIIQTANNHRPYTIPDEDLDEFKKMNFSKEELAANLFNSNEELNAFRYMDFSIRKYMEVAAKGPYFNNTIFVFIGDHGLRGSAGDLFPRSFSTYDFQAEHVPLLFYAPGKISPAWHTGVCSQLDVMPSLAHLAQQNHVNTTLGLNLFSGVEKERYAFIADPDRNTIATVGNRFYWELAPTGKTAFASVTDDQPVPQTTEADSIRRYMEQLTHAMQETARYLLLNNRKKNRQNR
ncbi:MAG TPA: sulfatase-like hydrolase/transferase [Ferruginibacter sp.]|nr:sulfatase-like hydrolase/transferase [Ferruginibacter sp.]